MKRILYITTLLALLWSVQPSAAQVLKQVEVSKDYAPTVSQAQKLAIIPDMTDTVKMQPEIEYSVTPRTYTTSLMTRNFRPATIAYWDYNPHRPLYVKAAVGVPLASEADAYLSTYNKDKGYAMVYANHLGDYRNRHNIMDEKVKSHTTEMSNRVGGRAGWFMGHHTLEADLYGDSQLRHRYPTTGERIAYGKFNGKVRFGDEFVDMSRWNFNLEAGGGVFRHKVRRYEQKPVFSQSSVEIDATIGKVLGGRHLFLMQVGYSGTFGGKEIAAYRNNSMMIGVRYGFSRPRTHMIIGADYYYDKVKSSTDSPHHILPYLHVTWKSATERFVPYAEIDGKLIRHDFSSLMYENPFFAAETAVSPALAALPNEVKYNGRVGVGGNLARGLFSYNLSAELSFADDHVYWYTVYGYYSFVTAYQHSLRLDGSVKIRPAGWLEAELSAKVYAWENYDKLYANRPSFTTALDIRVMTRRLKVGFNLDYAGGVKWLTMPLINGAVTSVEGVAGGATDGATDGAADGVTEPQFSYIKTRNTVSLNLCAEYRVNDRISVYAEGRNLTGSNIYEWLNYYYTTPRAMLGVKMTF